LFRSWNIPYGYSDINTFSGVYGASNTMRASGRKALIAFWIAKYTPDAIHQRRLAHGLAAADGQRMSVGR
jgi:hypothetical protein